MKKTYPKNTNSLFSSFFPYLLLFFALWIFTANLLQTISFSFLDDTFISFRYAKHLAQGHGLIWNLNEAPVEGFSNLLQIIDFVYLTTIENFQNKETEMIVHDQIPFSQHDEIKVEQVQMDPPSVKQDTEKPGVYEWAFKLAPAKKQTLKLSYRIKHPVEFVVEGL